MPRIMFDSLKLHKAVLELRYEKGYLYWDVCGKCILDINNRTEGKFDFSELSSNECILKFLENPRIKGSFGFMHMTLSGTKLKNVNVIKQNAPLILDSISKHLKLHEISRAGFRLFYVISKNSFEEAEKFVNELDICSIKMDRFKAFGENLSVAQPIFIVNDGDVNTRICITAARRRDDDEKSLEVDEYEPRYAVLLDLDFYKENVKLDEFNLEIFIHQSHKKIKDNVSHILNK